ncbi:MAG: HD domain-containing protein [Gammaproteobacteria bacterium]|nr:HD domain-containing protein [Gammaproteobacteria bacterium]NNF66132.1 bifunctional (p)ppGpp synthetase/guanosine-3',5'-bis(diphosphate) 3'-pyrophosphohydrolase [Gammaproteobacteria bacterium]
MKKHSEKESDIEKLLRAIRFAAFKHKEQRRKDNVTPYINHPIAVAENLTNIGGVNDIDTIVAAILHDTIEDTRTTGDELEESFGPLIRSIVEELTDDKNLPKKERKRLQIQHAPKASVQAKEVKLADKIANVNDLMINPPEGWSRERKLEYVAWSEKVVAGVRGSNAKLESHFDELCARVRSAED